MKTLSIFSIGTSGITDKEDAARIILVNKICWAVGLSIAIIGPTIGASLHWKPSVLIPLSAEFLINWSILLLNHYRKHLAANIVTYFLQVAAIAYFGVTLVKVLYLEFVVVLLIAVIFLLFKNALLRKIALAGALIDLAALEIYYYRSGLQDSLPMSYNAAFLIHVLVVTSIIGITILISKPYVVSNDLKPQLQRANFFMRTFIFQVTHDLRSSLDSIYQSAQLLKRDARRQRHSKETSTLLDIVLAASQDARNVVNNVLDVAEIESGRIPPSVLVPFRLRPFFERLIEVHQILARDKHVRLRLQTEMPDVIVSDPVNISQIFINLLSNAIKYGASGTTVRVRVMRDGAWWQLQVSNSGAPIPPEKIATIFEPYVTGRTGHLPGTGLGLYIVKSKVKDMEGNVVVESGPGRETVFTVRLPLIVGNPVDLPAEMSVGEEVTVTEGAQVLLAEDNKVSAFLLSRFLQEMNCRVTIVRNGFELLETVEKQCPDDRPDIIILDYHMPLLNGEETIRRLKALPHLKTIPVIVTTGDVFPDTLHRITAAGADSYLKKPIDHAALRATIGALLGNTQYH
jgi:signal transduction histidine kinase/ActR/RegA family two-component response regulator